MPQRGLSRAALVFKALCVLDEALDQARRGRVAPSLGLRFAIAFLYAVGDRRREYFDREPYDEFWRLATQSSATLLEGHNIEGYGRLNTMGANLNGIARAAGMPIEGEVTTALHNARQQSQAVTGQPPCP